MLVSQSKEFGKMNYFLRVWGRKGGHFRILIFEFGEQFIRYLVIEVRTRWLMFRKATRDKTEDKPPKIEPWVDEDGGNWHSEDWLKIYLRETAIVSFKDIYSTNLVKVTCNFR